MNYRHIYHAGNICDIVKHAALTLVLDHLRTKDAPFFVLDTHAGIGMYDLADPRAEKTAEAQQGILHLNASGALETEPLLASYRRVLRDANPDRIDLYPGSPLYVSYALRPTDRLVACELHPDDAGSLLAGLPSRSRIHVYRGNGYEALKAFLPPPEKRGLVLIDPPYERPDEFTTLATNLIAAARRWPQGIFMAWYPIKERPAVWRFHEQLIASGIHKILAAEFVYAEEIRHDRLNGSGLIFINPPWQLDDKLSRLFPVLHDNLPTPVKKFAITWLTKES